MWALVLAIPLIILFGLAGLAVGALVGFYAAAGLWP